MKLLWSSACSSRVAPIHLQPLLWPSFKFYPRECAGPKAAAVGDEEVGLPGELFRAQHAVILFLDPHFAAHSRHLSIHIQIVTCQIPPVMLGTQAVGTKSLQAARSLLTRQPYTSTADSLPY